MNKNNLLKFEDLYKFNLQDDFMNYNNYEEFFPFFENKNELFLNILFDKKEKIEINSFPLNDKEKKEFNCSFYLKSTQSSINNTNKKIFTIEKSKNDDKSLSKKTNINKNSYNKNQKNQYIKNITNIFVSKEKRDKIYRKDYYYKHFKAIFGKYLRNRLNNLKNRCFPNFIFNHFSTPHYSFIGNVKELDNYYFLFWTIKDIFVYKEKKIENNRQNNNRLLIEYIFKNENKNKDKEAYQELVFFLNNSLENAFLDFYENKNEYERINNDEDCIFYDKFFKKETGISLLEKNGFLKVIQKR